MLNIASNIFPQKQIAVECSDEKRESKVQLTSGSPNEHLLKMSKYI